MRIFSAVSVLLAAISFDAVAGETHRYTVLKDGEPVGAQSVTFDETDSGLNVSINWDVSVSFAGITLYRYEHERVERWVDGALKAFKGRTHDDGTDYDVSFDCGGTGCVWNVNGETRKFPSGIMPATVWNKKIIGQGSLISPVDKDFYEISAKSVGWQTVETGEGPVKAELVRVRGNIERDLWYDDTNRLVRMEFQLKDSTVELVLDGVTGLQTAQDRTDRDPK